MRGGAGRRGSYCGGKPLGSFVVLLCFLVEMV